MHYVPRAKTLCGRPHGGKRKFEYWRVISVHGNFGATCNNPQIRRRRRLLEMSENLGDPHDIPNKDSSRAHWVRLSTRGAACNNLFPPYPAIGATPRFKPDSGSCHSEIGQSASRRRVPLFLTLNHAG